MWQGLDMYGLICDEPSQPSDSKHSIPFHRIKFATYSTVGTVCPSALLGGLVDLDVLDDQVAGVETFGVGVGLGISEEAEKELG